MINQYMVDASENLMYKSTKDYLWVTNRPIYILTQKSLRFPEVYSCVCTKKFFISLAKTSAFSSVESWAPPVCSLSE